MNKLFGVELSGGSGRYCELDLPATDYELLDALDKLRLANGEPMRLRYAITTISLTLRPSSAIPQTFMS